MSLACWALSLHSCGWKQSGPRVYVTGTRGTPTESLEGRIVFCPSWCSWQVLSKCGMTTTRVQRAQGTQQWLGSPVENSRLLTFPPVGLGDFLPVIYPCSYFSA